MFGRSFLLLGLLFTFAEAYSFSERKWKFLLPRDVISELIQLDTNATSDPIGVDQAIDTILRSQPSQVLDQLDLPPYYERLPFVQRWQIKDVLFDRQLSYQQKHQMIYDIIHKLAPEQQKFPPVNSAQHSRYFEAFSSLQYQIGFTFKLSELKRALPPRDMQQILQVLGNHQIGLEASKFLLCFDKLMEVERVMSRQSFDVLDRLFFTGVPIVDAEARERFRRLFIDKGFWMAPKPKHPNCILKPWCNLKFGPKIEQEAKKPDLLVGPFNPLNNQQAPPQINPINGQVDSVKTVSEPTKQDINPMNGQMDSVKVESQPINVNENVKRLDISEPSATQKPQLQETVKGSLVIQVHAANSAPIKQEIPLSQLQQMQTIVVESQRVDVNGIPKVNVFVHKSGETKPKEEEKTPAVMKTARLQQTPTSNLPWQLPGSVQPSRVVKYGAPEAETTTEKPIQETEKPVDPQIWRPVEPLVDVQQRIQQAVQPITPLSIGPQSIQPTASQTIQQNNPPINQQVTQQFPTRWSIIRQGPWTHQDEKTFLQKWYKHFGIALSNAGGFVRKPIEQKEPETQTIKSMNEDKDQSTKSESIITESTIQPDSTTQVPFSQSNEAHIQALREANEKREIKKEEASKHEKESKASDDPVPATKLRDDTVAEAVRSETIRPPTVVINKESKEKLIVRHSIKGSTLHLEKLTSAELREDDTTTTQIPPKQTAKPIEKEVVESQTAKPENADDKPFQQPLNDTGSDLMESVAAEDSKKAADKVPSGLLKLRDVLRRLRERIRQLPNKNTTTLNWSQV